MNLFRWQWKDSRDVDPLAQRYLVKMTPPFVAVVPALVYSCTPGTSWMHLMWRFCTHQMCSIRTLSSSGTMRSPPFAPPRVRNSRSMRVMVVSSPRVVRRQYWLSSALLICLSTRRSVISVTPSCLSCCRFACRSRVRSPASHSKMHADRLPMKVG